MLFEEEARKRATKISRGFETKNVHNDVMRQQISNRVLLYGDKANLLDC